MNKDLAEEIKNHHQFFDIEKIDEEIRQAVEIADKKGLKLYCGEFGAYPTTPLELRIKWYQDMITIFDKYNIAWTHWNYKNDFPIVDENLEPIKEILDIMIPKK